MVGILSYCLVAHPDTLSINDSEDSIERMISLLRWYLTKDLKLVVSGHESFKHLSS